MWHGYQWVDYYWQVDKMEGEPDGDAAWFSYPYTIPEGVALICKDPNSDSFFCQVHGCRGTVRSLASAYRHMKQAHSHYPKSQVSASTCDFGTTAVWRGIQYSLTTGSFGAWIFHWTAEGRR